MTSTAERDAKILAASKAGNPPAAIAKRFKLTRDTVYNVLRVARKVEEAGGVPAVVAPPTGALAAYEHMLAAIAACILASDAKEIADQAEAMRVYARQAKNREAEIDAAEIRIRAERRLGELITAAKTAGEVTEGRPRKTVDGDDSFSRVKLKDAGIDRDLSSRAQKLAALPSDDFAWHLSDWRKHASEEGARVSVRLVKGDVQHTKAQARAVREEILGRQIVALPQQKFGVILADPEWRFEPWSRATGMDRAADNHYPTSATEVIASRPVGEIAAEHCVLFLWATAPMLPHALLVMDAWGFDYRSHFIWAKDRIGTGYWNRNRHELLLVGVKGNIPAPAMGTQAESLIEAAVGKHSEKPEIFLELIERYFPTLPKIELNRRGPARPGWIPWGNEVEETEAGPKVPYGRSLDAGKASTRASSRETGPARTSPALESTSPSNRDLSAGDKASSGAAPQGEAPLAGIGSETPAGHEGRQREGERTDEASGGERSAGLSPVAPDSPHGGTLSDAWPEIPA